ncbi:peptidyl-prolyl cis-trans isomerase [Hyphomonas sp.]|uniref:peptidylprolyl isomerase n=1 Tax=Hyphomonas sp. TaxID=87 RepID=UPI00352940AD
MTDTTEKVRRWPVLLREPLVHFILAALAVFIAWNVVTSGRADEARTIRVSSADLERLASIYTAEAGALPSGEDMVAMVNDYVRDEALAREAKRLGLDEGDTIVTRRLAQKMTFMVADLAREDTPDDAVLREWYETHADRFTEPQKVTFRHVFFSEDVRGASATADAEAALGKLNAGDDWREAGDPFMLQRAYGDLPLREVVRLFGGEFAQSLAATPASGLWTGPIRSALGVHLVQVETNAPPQLQPFEDVKDAVLADWQDETRREANEKAIQDIIARYKVEVEGINAD